MRAAQVSSGAAERTPTAGAAAKGTSVFDSMEKTKPGARFGPSTSANSGTPSCPPTGASATKKVKDIWWKVYELHKMTKV